MTGTRINGAYQKKFIGDLVWMLQFSVGKSAYDTGGHLPMCLGFLVQLEMTALSVLLITSYNVFYLCL
jgi:hypothetical protein